MNAPDTLKRLEGEPEIPSLTPRGGASSHKPIIAASVLILSLVGALARRKRRQRRPWTWPPRR